MGVSYGSAASRKTIPGMLSYHRIANNLKVFAYLLPDTLLLFVWKAGSKQENDDVQNDEIHLESWSERTCQLKAALKLKKQRSLLKNWKIWLTWNSNETTKKGAKSDRSQNYDLSSCLGTKNIVHWGPMGVRIQHNIKSRQFSTLVFILSGSCLCQRRFNMISLRQQG